MTKKTIPQHLRIWLYVGLLAIVVTIIGVLIKTFLIPAPPSHYQLAQQAYLVGDYNTALREFGNAVEEDPSNPEYLIGRGLTYLSYENYALALNDFNNAIVLNPESNDTRPYLHGGYITLLAGEYDIAVEALTTAIERGNSSALVYSYRGLAYYNLEDYAAAVTDLKTATDIDDSMPDVYRTLGDANYAQGNNDAALTAYNRYLELTTIPEPYVIENINAINTQ